MGSIGQFVFVVHLLESLNVQCIDLLWRCLRFRKLRKTTQKFPMNVTFQHEIEPSYLVKIFVMTKHEVSKTVH